VIVLTPNRAIERLDGVALVPLPDGRALVSLEAGTSIAEFRCSCATRSTATL
jgi:hypothetical protein